MKEDAERKLTGHWALGRGWVRLPNISKVMPLGRVQARTATQNYVRNSWAAQFCTLRYTHSNIWRSAAHGCGVSLPRCKF